MNPAKPILRKGPEQPDRFTANLEFTISAGAAWREILRRIASERGRPARLLMPPYIGQTAAAGSGIFDPVREAKAEYVFYPVNSNLVPDQVALAKLLETRELDALLVVHWFGFIQVDLAVVKTLCDRHGVILVEDCAHCLFGHDQLPGRTGHYAYYSIHKMYPTGTGGILRHNTAQSLLGQQAGSDRLEACEPAVLEQVIRTDKDAVIDRRRENYAFLWEAMSGIPQVEPQWTLGPQTTPHNFPVFIGDGQREKLYFYLLERGFPTIALYYQMIDELNRDKFPNSFEIANKILNFPVHQDTDIEDLVQLVTAIRAYFG